MREVAMGVCVCVFESKTPSCISLVWCRVSDSLFFSFPFFLAKVPPMDLRSQ